MKISITWSAGHTQTLYKVPKTCSVIASIKNGNIFNEFHVFQEPGEITTAVNFTKAIQVQVADE